MDKAHSKQTGFTIVELLVVVVIISVLAAIVSISFFNLSNKAIITTLKSDLASASGQFSMYKVDNNNYPASLSVNSNNYCPIPTNNRYCIRSSPGNSLQYESTDNGHTYTLDASNVNGAKYRITNSSSIAIEMPPSSNGVTATGGSISDSGGTRTHTFTTNGTFTVTKGGSITITTNGGGGGGGGQDNVGNAANGNSGDKVVYALTVNSGDDLNIVIGNGGLAGGSNSQSGALGGSGYVSGVGGGDGTDDSEAWAYGGGGGGGSSAVVKSGTRIIEARGGNGGRSSDYLASYGWAATGGNGGSGGGANYPALTTQYGANDRGLIDNNANNGSTTISYSI